MSEKEAIKSLIKQGELYFKQSLLNQSKEAYQKALELIESNEKLPNREKLIQLIQGKIKVVEENLNELEAEPDQPELSEELQKLIQKRFAFSKNEETAAFEGAMALAKFGQYEQALEEFHKLLKKGVMPLVAAKNIITCMLTYASPDAAIAQYIQWTSQDVLSKPQLNQVRVYLKSLLEKKGMKAELPPVIKPKKGEEEEEEAVIDISSITMTIPEGPRKGETIELDVSFQMDNNISVVIAADQKDLLKSLKTGTRLTDIQCYSPIGFFNGSGMVLGRTQIQEGPKKGDYLLDIAIDAG